MGRRVGDCKFLGLCSTVVGGISGKKGAGVSTLRLVLKDLILIVLHCNLDLYSRNCIRELREGGGEGGKELSSLL